MEKIKLLGISKSEKHNKYEFPKEQKILGILRQLLKEIGIGQYTYESFGRTTNKKTGEPIYDKEEKIKSYIDQAVRFDNKEYCVDIVFGKSRVFLFIHTEKNKQKEIARITNKFIKK